MRYREYIDSPAWAAKRATYFARHPKRCAACNGTEAIHLHHLTYERLGRELDSDLIPLCEQCHALAHAYQRSHRCSLNEATAAVILFFRGATLPRAKPAPKQRRRRPRPRPNEGPSDEALAAEFGPMRARPWTPPATKASADSKRGAKRLRAAERRYEG